MGLLSADIAVLLAIAAIVGCAVVYWWTGLHFRDLSSEYGSLRSQLDEFEAQRRGKVEAEVKVAALDAENAHLERRLADEIEWRRGVGPKLDELVAAVRDFEPTDPKPVEKRRRRIRGGTLLRSASQGPADDLKRISGIGPKLETMLNDIGVFYLWQVSSWSAADVQYIDRQLETFRGRVERDDWVGQARALAAASTPPSWRRGAMPGDALRRWPQTSPGS